MTTRLNPYINFLDNTREAMGFYQSVLGGELAVSTFGEGGMSQEESDKDLVMHSQIDTDDGLTLMASDTPAHMRQGDATPEHGQISLSGDDTDRLTALWQGLSDGATITVPLEKAPWGDSFGMLTDKYGVPWMVNIAGSGQQE
ncbi:VOC family protein [Angustibacter peucedani]